MNYDEIFQNYKLDKDKLLKYGFEYKDEIYTYQVDLSHPDFYLILSITSKSFDIKVFDKSFNDEYLPFSLKTSNGSFVTAMREEVQNKVKDVIKYCFIYDSIKQKVLEYVQETYCTVPENPWKESPTHTTLKTTKKQKWYGIIMTIPYQKLGIEKEGLAEVMNLKNKPEKISQLIDHQNYFPAYHMNKRYWISVLLDNSLEKEIYELIDESYKLVEK